MFGVAPSYGFPAFNPPEKQGDHHFQPPGPGDDLHGYRFMGQVHYR